MCCRDPVPHGLPPRRQRRRARRCAGKQLLFTAREDLPPADLPPRDCPHSPARSPNACAATEPTPRSWSGTAPTSAVRPVLRRCAGACRAAGLRVSTDASHEGRYWSYLCARPDAAARPRAPRTTRGRARSRHSGRGRPGDALPDRAAYERATRPRSRSPTDPWPQATARAGDRLLALIDRRRIDERRRRAAGRGRDAPPTARRCARVRAGERLTDDDSRLADGAAGARARRSGTVGLGQIIAGSREIIRAERTLWQTSCAVPSLSCGRRRACCSPSRPGWGGDTKLGRHRPRPGDRAASRVPTGPTPAGTAGRCGATGLPQAVLRDAVRFRARHRVGDRRARRSA